MPEYLSTTTLLYHLLERILSSGSIFFSLRIKYPSPILIIGVIKYPIEASWTLLILTAKIKPVQLTVINNAVMDSIIIFFNEKKIKIKSLIFVNKNKIKNKKINDHNPLCKATSIDGT